MSHVVAVVAMVVTAVAVAFLPCVRRGDVLVAIGTGVEAANLLELRRALVVARGAVAVAGGAAPTAAAAAAAAAGVVVAVVVAVLAALVVVAVVVPVPSRREQ